MSDKPLLEKSFWGEHRGAQYKVVFESDVKEAVRELKEWVSSQPKRELYHSRIKSKIDEVFWKGRGGLI